MKFPTITRRPNPTIVFDVETNGLDWKRNQTVGIAVCVGPNKEDSYYFPIRHASGNVDLDAVLAWVRKWAQDSRIRVVGHNLKFDLHFAQNDGIEFKGPVECTMVNAALINENMSSYSLEAVARAYDVPQLKEGDALYKTMACTFGGEPVRKKQMEHFHKMPGNHRQVVEYARADVSATWHVWNFQQHELFKSNLTTVALVEQRVLRTLQRMERRGVRVDEEGVARLRARLEGRIDVLTKKLPARLKTRDEAETFIRSPKQLKAWFQTKGVSGWPQTAKGNDSFPEVWLSTHKPGQLIVELRKTTNMINSFVEPLITTHIFNGRVHTTFNQLRQDEYGTVTGRLSSNDPNMQQVPKRDKKLAPLFRSIFLPDVGHYWSANDYSQQEFRVFADYSQAALLMDGYSAHPPIDIHTNIARLLNVERDPTAKRMNLGMLYGMGSKKLAASLGVDEDEAKILRAKYDAVLPEARKFIKEAEFWARRRGWVKTKLGRRRRFPDPTFAHKAGNSVIQGTSADMTKLKMVEIDDLFQKHDARSGLLLQVHDELDWTVHPDEIELDVEAQRIMQDFGDGALIQLRVPIIVDHKEGDHWGRATFNSMEKEEAA